MKHLFLLFILFLPFSSLHAAEPTGMHLQPARSFNPDFIGFNGNIMQLGTDPWQNREFVEKVNLLKPRTVRYPAGTLGNYWDWDLGWLAQDIDDKYLIRWVVTNDFKGRSTRYTLEHLHRGVKDTGFTPVYVANMLDTKEQEDGDHLDMMLRALRRARDMGMPVKYIELGNEYYFGLMLEKYNFRTPERYGEVCTEWIELLRKDHPEAQIAIIGGGPMNNDRNMNWTRRSLSTCSTADAVTVHAYTDSGLFGLGEKKDFKIEAEGKAAEEEKYAAMSPEEKSAAAIELLQTPEGIARMMWTGAHAFENKLKKVNMPEDPNLKIWVTEWNMTHRASGELGTWANALFISLMYESMLDDGRVELSHIHNLLGNAFAVIYSGEEPLQQVTHRKINLGSDEMRIAPAGWASIWLGQASDTATLTSKILFADNPEITSDYGKLDSLYGWAFGSDPGITGAWMINLQSTPVEVRLHDAVAALTAITHYASDPHLYMVEDPPEKTAGVLHGQTLTLPPYSITVLTQP